MEIEVFAQCNNLLGEAPLWHSQRQSLFWLDILNCRLFEKNILSENDNPDSCWDLPEMASVMAVDGEHADKLWLLTDQSFGSFSLLTGEYKALINLNMPITFRANDGAVASNGEFWFGTMERIPTGLHGSIYTISTQGRVTQQLQHIGIPNTFCWSRDGSTLYLSDSFRQKIFRYDCTEGAIMDLVGSTFLDLSEGESTPDGGAVDQLDNLWNCQWDGFRVACYGSVGDLLQVIGLPLPRPTSCCFGGTGYRTLYITSARHDLGDDLLVKYPLSGSVLKVDLPIAGQLIPSFSLKE